MNTAVHSPATEATPPETLLESLRFLLRRYGRTPSPAVAGNIADCVEKLLADRSFRVPPAERCTYRQMRTYWRLVESLG
jgi:hypothetical protein